MRWFFDTEFDENGTTIKLISIGLVSEKGDEYYAVCADGWSPRDCSLWVRDNVIAKLPPGHDSAWKTRRQIAEEIKDLVGDKPEFWAYFADYDWVALCQLYGRMLDLPTGWPMYCRDLKQTMDSCGYKKTDLPDRLQFNDFHTALEDAHWVRKAWAWAAGYDHIIGVK